jgi:hypothetical protein
MIMQLPEQESCEPLGLFHSQNSKAQNFFGKRAVFLVGPLYTVQPLQSILPSHLLILCIQIRARFRFKRCIQREASFLFVRFRLGFR